MRTADATAIVDRFCQRLRQRRRMLILFKRRHADHASVPDLGPVRAPMGCSSNEALVHGSLFRFWSAICLLSNYYDFRPWATMSNEVLNAEDRNAMSRFHLLSAAFAALTIG